MSDQPAPVTALYYDANDKRSALIENRDLILANTHQLVTSANDPFQYMTQRVQAALPSSVKPHRPNPMRPRAEKPYHVFCPTCLLPPFCHWTHDPKTMTIQCQVRDHKFLHGRDQEKLAWLQEEKFCVMADAQRRGDFRRHVVYRLQRSDLLAHGFTHLQSVQDFGVFFWDAILVPPNNQRPDYPSLDQRPRISQVTLAANAVLTCVQSTPVDDPSKRKKHYDQLVACVQHYYQLLTDKYRHNTSNVDHQLITNRAIQVGEVKRVHKFSNYGMMGKVVQNGARATVGCDDSIHPTYLGVPVHILYPDSGNAPFRRLTRGNDVAQFTALLQGMVGIPADARRRRQRLLDGCSQRYVLAYRAFNEETEQHETLWRAGQTLTRLTVTSTHIRASVNKQITFHKMHPRDEMEYTFTEGDLVLAARCPVNHHQSMMAFHIKPIDGKVIRFNTLVTEVYGMDFDGDFASLFFLSSAEAIHELKTIYAVNCHMRSHMNGTCAFGLMQDHVECWSYLTREVVDGMETFAQILSPFTYPVDTYLTKDDLGAHGKLIPALLAQGATADEILDRLYQLQQKTYDTTVALTTGMSDFEVMQRVDPAPQLPLLVLTDQGELVYKGRVVQPGRGFVGQSPTHLAGFYQDGNLVHAAVSETAVMNQYYEHAPLDLEEQASTNGMWRMLVSKSKGKPDHLRKAVRQGGLVMVENRTVCHPHKWISDGAVMMDNKSRQPCYIQGNLFHGFTQREAFMLTQQGREKVAMAKGLKAVPEIGMSEKMIKLVASELVMSNGMLRRNNDVICFMDQDLRQKHYEDLDRPGTRAAMAMMFHAQQSVLDCSKSMSRDPLTPVATAERLQCLLNPKLICPSRQHSPRVTLTFGTGVDVADVRQLVEQHSRITFQDHQTILKKVPRELLDGTDSFLAQDEKGAILWDHSLPEADRKKRKVTTDLSDEHKELRSNLYKVESAQDRHAILHDFLLKRVDQGNPFAEWVEKQDDRIKLHLNYKRKGTWNSTHSKWMQKVHFLVDQKNTTVNSDNVYDVYHLAGAEAAQDWTCQQLQNLFPKVHPNHLDLISKIVWMNENNPGVRPERVKSMMDPLLNFHYGTSDRMLSHLSTVDRICAKDGTAASLMLGAPLKRLRPEPIVIPEQKSWEIGGPVAASDPSKCPAPGYTWDPVDQEWVFEGDVEPYDPEKPGLPEAYDPSNPDLYGSPTYEPGSPTYEPGSPTYDTSLSPIWSGSYD